MPGLADEVKGEGKGSEGEEEDGGERKRKKEEKGREGKATGKRERVGGR